VAVRYLTDMSLAFTEEYSVVLRTAVEKFATVAAG